MTGDRMGRARGQLGATAGAVAAYIRVSSRAQDHRSQRSAIERAARARGDAIAAWYADTRTGETADRAALEQLRADARAGSLRKVYVFRLDRLSREGIRGTLAVVDELRAHGVELVTIADGFDLQGPGAELVLCVLAWAARQELQARAERIAAARDRIEREGGSWGRPRRLNARQVEHARSMRESGLTLRQLAVAMKVPRATLARALGPSQKPVTIQPPSRPAKRARRPTRAPSSQ